jgi:YbbR domain-containing protein
MYEWLRRDLGYKGLAIVFSILLWFFVTNQQNPSIINKSVMVPITYSGLKEGLLVADKLKNVEIKIRGPQTIVNTLTYKDIKATVDLSKAKLGADSYIVEVVPPSGVELVLTRPSSISLRVDPIEGKQLPIRVIKQGTVAQGYTSFEPVLTPSTVVVRGSKQMLANLETALVTVNLEQAKDNLILTPPVTILSKSGPVSDMVDISPKTVQVFVPVTKPSNTYTVPIRPNIKGEPKNGLQVSRVIVDPETVKISGSYEILSEITQVSTAPIDITGIGDNYAVQVALIKPAGATLLYQPTAKVIVQVDAVSNTRHISDIPVTVVDKKEGYQYIIRPDKINLTIRGPKQEIEALDTASIRPYVDVKTIEEGTHNLEVKVDLPGSMKVNKIDPGTVEVKMIKG